MTSFTNVEDIRAGRGPRPATGTFEEIRAAADRDGKTEPVLAVDVVAENGEAVARVTKRLRLRRKAAVQGPPAGGTTR